MVSLILFYRDNFMLPMTAQGLSQLQKELRDLMSKRPLISEEIARARQYGDLSENAEYHAAREKQRWTEERIREIQEKISQAQVIDISELSGTKIIFGSFVTLHDEDRQERHTYQIVGVDEADLAQKKIAITSALARELIGKEKGMNIELITPGGEKHFFIENVSYTEQL